MQVSLDFVIKRKGSCDLGYFFPHIGDSSLYGIPSSLLPPLNHRNNFIVLDVDLKSHGKDKVLRGIVTGHRVWWVGGGKQSQPQRALVCWEKGHYTK